MSAVKLRVGPDANGRIGVWLEDGRPLAGVTKVTTTLAGGDLVRTTIELIGVAHALPDAPRVIGTCARRLDTVDDGVRDSTCEASG